MTQALLIAGYHWQAIDANADDGSKVKIVIYDALALGALPLPPEIKPTEGTLRVGIVYPPEIGKAIAAQMTEVATGIQVVPHLNGHGLPPIPTPPNRDQRRHPGGR